MYELQQPAKKRNRLFLYLLVSIAIVISMPFVCFGLLIVGAFLKGFFWL